MKKTTSEGKIYYYYYKKKRGRKKKRGPKKKKIIKERTIPVLDYKILLCESNKQDKYIGCFHNLSEVEMVKAKLIEKNNNVIFPIQFKNSGKMTNFKYEYIILQRQDNAHEITTKLPNDYGIYVDHSTSSNNWVIIDKIKAEKEETFWVYGYHPKKDRKDFKWIIDNLLTAYLTQTTSLQICLYNNKVLFRYDDDFNFVICKNKSDAIRMYNLLETYVNGVKLKKVFFTGMITRHGYRTNTIVKMLQEKTGWSLFKIYRTSTRS